MADDSPLDGKAAVVTGASAGIGKATADALAADGADVALAARSEGALRELADEIEGRHGVEALAIPTDVREHEQVAAMVDEAVGAFGRLDVLVNNAGITGSGFDERVEEIPIDHFDAMLETNVSGMFYATHAALPHLRESKGNLVFIGSSAGKLPRPGNPIYSATKWWTRGFALSVEGHAGRDGVAVTLINPTAVRTRLWPDRDEHEAAEPEEVAALVAIAARQAPHSTLSEVDLFRRDMIGQFLPASIDASSLPFEVD